MRQLINSTLTEKRFRKVSITCEDLELKKTGYSTFKPL